MDFKDPALKQKNGPAPRSGLGGLKREWSNPDADLNGSGKSTATKGKEVIDLSGDDDGIPGEFDLRLGGFSERYSFRESQQEMWDLTKERKERQPSISFRDAMIRSTG